MTTTLADIPLTTITGEATSLGAFAGKVLLIVNVASRCGLAPQYEKLEALQKKYESRGFTVLGFPSNQFLQELGKNEAIAEYCSATWGVTFPMFDKVKVNGKGAHPLYQELVK
ncbi:MAG TPA: glutathione peroxidase, partial [Rhodoglobus sp.]|nr:glutathione peroxidase [Rhodoglobus sp.]